MRVLMVASEATPFAHTGGLAEVLFGLPGELVKLGVQIDVLIPKYRGIDDTHFPIVRLPISVEVDLNARIVKAGFWELKDTRGVRYLFLENDEYYDRESLYGASDGEYEDNSERFVFLSRSAIELSLVTNQTYDVFHSHNWYASLIPVYLRTLYAGQSLLLGSASIITIHNLGKQGKFARGPMSTVGLSEAHFSPEQKELYDQVNFLKSGIVFADEINTVSPGYRNEILTTELGFGLEENLRTKEKNLTGILNGVDYSSWNPATDSVIAARYSPEDLSGKAACKADLQALCNLPVQADAPVVGIAYQLTNQKGIDLLDGVIPLLIEQDVQLVVLGEGETRFERSFSELASQFPRNVSFNLKYDDDLAHKIYAGSDMIVIPSRYEPCGLVQLYALKYGAVPIVRATGGLNDTVEECNSAKDSGTGFKFIMASSSALEQAFKRALDLYRKNSDEWTKLIIRGMSQDFSWTKSACEYKKLYERAIESRKATLSKL